MINISDLVKTILTAIPFLLIVFATERINLKRPQRGHQFATMVLAVLFSVVGIVRFEQFCNKFIALVNALSALLMTLAGKVEKLSSILTMASSWLSNIDWAKWITLVANCVLFIAFLVIKAILLPIFKRVWNNETIYSATSGIAYKFNEGVSNYCLKDNFYFVKKLTEVYYYIAAGTMISLLVDVQRHPERPAYKAVMYPFAVIIIVGEIYYFLQGLTAAEYRNRYSGDDGASERVALYYPFKHYLEIIFGDRLIDVATYFPGYKHNNIDVLKKYEEMDTQESKLTNIFFYKKTTTRKKRETEDLDEKKKKVSANDENAVALQLDESLVDATYKLLNGESVLFASPFYRDYSDYIFLPLNRALMKGNKVLFIVGRNGIAEDVQNWIVDSFESVSNVPELWKIDNLAKVEDYDGDVAIVNAADMFNEDIVRKNSAFVKNVTEVVMLEPSQFISTAQLSISVYVANVAENATYYVFDKNTDGLVDTISHLIKKSVVSVTPTSRERNINTYMLWRADGDNLSHKLFPSVARYLGMGTELMISAIKEQVSQAEWYAYNKFPLDEMKWITHQYYPVLCEYAALPVEEEEIESRLKFSHNIWGAQKSDYKYMVVEDEFCNLYEMARQFQSRGRKETFVNVISQNYLLRDYMEFNPDLFVNDPKAIPSFSPDYVRTDRNIALELILNMYSRALTEKEVVNALRALGIEQFFGDYKTYDVKVAVFDLINKYIPNQKRSIESVIDERDKTYRIRRSLKNDIDDSIKILLSELKSIYYVLEDDEARANYLDSKLYGQVFQSHLPGQHITIAGRYYEIVVIGGQKGVILKRAGDHISNREYYRQLRKYTFDSFEVEDKVGSKTTLGDIVIEKGEACFSVDTSGYLLLKNYGDITNECYRNEVSNIPQRNYKNKTVLRITLPDISPKEKATITLILNEIFKTTYAENCDYVCALSSIDGFNDTEGLMYDFVYSDDYLSAENQDEDSVDEYIYIVEDSVLDMGLIDSVERNLQRFLEIVYDYLEWYNHMLQPIVVIDDVVKTDVVVIDKDIVNGALTDKDKKDKKDKKKKKKKKSLIQRIKDFFKKKKKKKDPKGGEDPTGDNDPKGGEDPTGDNDPKGGEDPTGDNDPKGGEDPTGDNDPKGGEDPTGDNDPKGGEDPTGDNDPKGGEDPTGEITPSDNTIKNSDKKLDDIVQLGTSFDDLIKQNGGDSNE